MLIQNISNISLTPQLGRISSDRLTIDGRPAPISSPAPSEPHVAADFPQASQLKNAVGKFNDVMRQSKQNLEFSVDTDTKKPVVKLVDTETGDVIRQIPSEEMLSIARSIDHFQQGLLLKQKA
jgi:flagellar protein FlaG